LKPLVDFSSNARVFDRRHGSVLAPDVARSLASAGALERGPRVLDIGAGTGRVAIASASLGFDGVALEPAVPMLDECRRKATGQPIHLVAGDGVRLPSPEAIFDAAVLARILYLMPDWQAVLREAYNVLKPGGSLVHE
jgi:demethylmenaquinone methyltransferase/2-methoxy-6-polyprenyl-1,4-benzoquinol methylase